MKATRLQTTGDAADAPIFDTGGAILGELTDCAKRRGVSAARAGA